MTANSNLQRLRRSETPLGSLGMPGRARFPRTAIEQSIHERFAYWRDRAPGGIAVRTRDATLTYDELGAWADAIALRLLEGIGLDAKHVPFVLPQGPLAIATTLGILKAGKSYVPLDGSWQPGRIQELVRELKAPLVVTDETHAPALRELLGASAVIALSRDRPSATCTRVEIQIAPSAPAYVYFTSGSSGRPKGVIDCHRNVLHNVMRYTNALDIDGSDRLTLLQPCSFSGAVSSMFAALLNGASACPVEARQLSPARFAEWIDALEVTIYHSVPALFRNLGSSGRVFRHVRVVRLEGDLATRLDLELFRAHFVPPCRVAVGLGATETGLVCQYFFDHTTPMPTTVVPIGHAAQDMRFDIRGDDGKIAPQGTAGEIVVHSAFLATGYLDDPEASARAFSDPDPGSGERAYRTGDLGRIAADGALEYLGRLDSRVRIHGHWVELADVDAAMGALPGIREAVAMPLTDIDGVSRLVAWFVPTVRPSPTRSALRRQLAERLPAHMLPTRYIELERFPLNENGKLDRGSLPHPGRAPELDVALSAPATPIERRLCELWRSLLEVEPIGIHDDFFDLGGDSLLAMQLVARVGSLFGVDLPLASVFTAPTLAGLAKEIELLHDGSIEYAAQLSP